LTERGERKVVYLHTALTAGSQLQADMRAKKKDSNFAQHIIKRKPQ
jgi:hypothetical protein